MATLIPVSLSNLKFDEIASRIKKSFPDSCILWIDEIKNPDLEEEHLLLFEEIKKKRPNIVVTQQELFHGTSESAAKFICDEGFKTEYNTVSAYGKGTYFAKDASYSFGYSTKNSSNREIVYMLLCSVIVGATEIGTDRKKINTHISDNTVDKLKDPFIVVTPYDKGGIPKYLIAFHKNPT